MKTFRNLKFQQHINLIIGFQTRAKMFFKNGYGVSVITGSSAYTSTKKPYELAVIKGNTKVYTLCYDTPITDDVVGYLDAKGVTDIMKKIQKLKRVK
jgi:hypothetical protein